MIEINGNILYWFTRDLRVMDNKILHSVKHARSLCCVYIVDPAWFKHQLWQRPSLSENRWQFTLESLEDLKRSLLPYGQRLLILYGDPVDVLETLINDNRFDRLVASKHAGTYEQKRLRELESRLPTLGVSTIETRTLFDRTDLPFYAESLPGSYSKFRRIVEELDVAEPLRAPPVLPAMPELALENIKQLPAKLTQHNANLQGFAGGETAAQAHLNSYFSSPAPSRYKQVRNELSGWENSSKLSAWLSIGCLSPRQVKQSIDTYEIERGQNESTKWLYIELLWREYFQWLHYKIRDTLFAFSGCNTSPPLTTFYPERFRKWCEGETPYPLVNACMKELKTTGYLSNRGRQIVASCLVNELGLDWRYGAAWFEHTLIDYDVATNWGNWQYIAGVGVDPRGGRHFNLEKQEAQYDPDMLYQKRWGVGEKHSLDSRDAADWPISID